MGELNLIRPQERPLMETAKLEELSGLVGATAAEEMVYRAMEEMALRISHMEQVYLAGQRAEMRKNARAMIAIADQIGMTSVARIAKDVVQCIDDSDRVALAATFARLARLCEVSLTTIWDLQDFHG